MVKRVNGVAFRRLAPFLGEMAAFALGVKDGRPRGRYIR
jgi:hypothetical protein